MKGTPASLWMSAASRAAGWWMGHAANAVRLAQARAVKKALAAPKRKPRKGK